MSKRIISLIIFLVIFGLLGGTIIYHQKKARWLAHKQAIENQKAEEITIRIIEGWTNKAIGEYLESKHLTSSANFLTTLSHYWPQEINQLLPPEAKGNLQGFLFPDTYRLFKSLTDRIITSETETSQIVIKKLLTQFFSQLPDQAEHLAKQQGLSLYEAITLASIVENETGRNVLGAESKRLLDQERKIVAGIFYNRLRANIPLQSDATINYITGKKDPGASLVDLEINSPYNTYKHRGLPPTPISNPSLSSILAVLNPTTTDYFYFLHKQPSGEPIYSKTFEEHIKNKFKYLK